MNHQSFDRVDSREQALALVRELLLDADGQVLFALPAAVLPAVEDTLAQVGSDVLRCLLIYGDEASVRAATSYDMGELASVARLWDVEPGFTVLISDHHGGLMVQNELFDGSSARGGIVFGGPEMYHLAYAWFIAHPWEMGTEWYTADPRSLPETYDDFRLATFQATLLLHADRRVQVTMEAKPTGVDGPFETVTGQLVATRQQFLYPKLSAMFGETAIHVRTDDGRYSVGGLDAYLEDYEARSIRFEPLD